MGLSRRLRPLCGLAAAAALAAPALAATTGPGPSEVVDEAHRFRLVRPGPEWHVLDAEAASTLSPGALAGAILADSAAIVYLDGRAEGDLAATARSTVESLVAKPLGPVEYTRVSFHGRPAVRAVAVAAIEGSFVRYVHLFYENGGYVFRLSVSGPVDATTEDAAAAVERAFDLLPGEVRPLAAKEAAPRAGPGWRSAAGTYESLRLGLRVRVPAGWKVYAGEGLWSVNPDAEVIFEDASGLTSVSLTADRVRPEGARAIADRIAAAGPIGAGKVFGAPVALRFAAKPIPFRTWIPAPADEPGAAAGAASAPAAGAAASADPSARPAGEEADHLFSAMPLGKHVLQIWITCLRGPSEPCARRAAPLLEAVEVLAPAERKKLGAALATAAPPPPAAIGLDFALRHGVYRSFSSHVTWTTPAGTWDLFPGDAARVAAGSPEAVLVVREPTVGLTGTLLSVWPDDRSLSARHADDVADSAAWLGLEGPAPKPTVRPLAGATMWVTRLRGARPSDAIPVQVTVATIEGGGAGYLLLLVETDAAASRPAAGALIDALRILPAAGLPAKELGTGRYSDHRMGFEFDSRELGLSRSEPTPSSSSSAHVRWTLGDRGAGIVATDVAFEQEPDRLARLLHDRTAAALSSAVDSAPSPGVLTLAGHVALHTYWERPGLRFDLLTAAVDGVVYQLTVSTPDATEAAVLAMIARFRLID